MMRRRLDPRLILRWGPPLVLAVVFLALRWLGDRWWPLLPLLFGPRWPLVILVPLPLLAGGRGRWRGTALALGASFACFLAIIDFRIPWRALLPSGDPTATELRILSWNAAGGGGNADAALAMIADEHADVTILAECGPELAKRLAADPMTPLHRTGDLCVRTTLPVIAWEPRSPDDFYRAGGSGAIGRLTVMVGEREVVIGAVHLETPREALEELRFLAPFAFRRAAIASQQERDIESEVARNWIVPADEARPVVVAGDFNLVQESAIFDRWWGDLTDAFAVRGFGTGWTKLVRGFGARIDHVLVTNGVAVRGVSLGDRTGSDHRPVIAELAVPASSPGER